MKKIIALALALISVVTMGACAGENAQETHPAYSYNATPLEVLTQIWNLYEDEDLFSVMGGHYESPVLGMPGSYDMQKTEDLQYAVLLTPELVARVQDAATMVHMNNANFFTCGAWNVSGDAEEFAQLYRENMASQQWVCGSVEYLCMYQVGEVIVVAYGSYDIIDIFVEYTRKAWPGAKELYLGEVVQ